MIKQYYRLAKPGIIYGNALTTIAAFLFAAHFSLTSPPFAATVLGIALVIGSACVFNNYLDRDIDAKMDRTKHRALVSGNIAARAALIYATALGVIGFVLLIFFVNILTAEVAFVGFFFYVILYTYSKRYSPLGTLVGSVSGATPILAGYTAVTDRLDTAALMLFLVLVVWQMPHFYAIAIRRIDDYRAAGIPVLPVVRGNRVTKVHIVMYILAYLVATSSLTYFGFEGYTYFSTVLLFGFAWLYIAASGFKTLDDTKWARKLFLFSLVVLLSFCIMLPLGTILP